MNSHNKKPLIVYIDMLLTYLHVTDKVGFLYETFTAYFTLIAPAAKVCACDMNSQCRSSREAFVAMMAAVCLLM
jgi:hypothetical protein